MGKSRVVVGGGGRDLDYPEGEVVVASSRALVELGDGLAVRCGEEGAFDGFGPLGGKPNLFGKLA